MAPAILAGDCIIVDVQYYQANNPQRGDVIVFQYPEDPKRIFIKRVIAVGGDVVELKDKIVYLNGKAIDDPHAYHSDHSILPCGKKQAEKIGTGELFSYSVMTCEEPRDNYGPSTVASWNYFVMGDNRDQSFDSRHWGYVHKGYIVGKPLYLYWSNDKDRIGMKIE